MTGIVAAKVRRIMHGTRGWTELAECHPRMAEAVAALPDESKMVYVNAVLRDVLNDAIERAVRWTDSDIDLYVRKQRTNLLKLLDNEQALIDYCFEHHATPDRKE